MYQYRPSSSLAEIRLVIEASPTGVTHCKACQKKIGSGEARVAFHRRCASSLFYHLYCFTPAVRVRIKDNSVKVIGTEIQEEVEEWVNDWNKQFDLSPANLHIFTEKQVKTEANRHKRILLESFKYLDAISIVKLVTGVSREWYHVSWEDELWQVLTRTCFPEWTGKQASRKDFLKAWFTSCAHCNKALKNEQRHMVCPLTFRPKCVGCFRDANYRPIRLNWAKNEYLLPRSLIKELGFSIFSYDGEDCIYLYQAADRLKAKRREQIVQVLELLSQENESELFPRDLLNSLRAGSDDDLLKPGRFHYYLYRKDAKDLVEFVFQCKKLTKFPALLEKLAKASK